MGLPLHDLVLRLPLCILVCSCLLGSRHNVFSETSYNWKLDLDLGKVMPASYLPQPPPLPPAKVKAAQGHENGSGKVNGKANNAPMALDDHEAMLDILLSTVTSADGSWKKTGRSRGSHNQDSDFFNPRAPLRNNRGQLIPEEMEAGDLEDSDDDHAGGNGADIGSSEALLHCGKPVNFTYYDHLLGLQNRGLHPNKPEPGIVYSFKFLGAPFHTKAKRRGGSNAEGGNAEYEREVIEQIERRLVKAKREMPKSVDLYHQIANFWRVKGETRRSMECFRRALAVAPNNAEILLNLARLMYHLRLLDDAVFLTRRSLEVQPPDQNAWPQHLMLGEILKEFCHHQEAALHLRHVLELKPGYAPALAALAELEPRNDPSLHVYTILIIVLLVGGVLGWIVTTLDAASKAGRRASGNSQQEGSDKTCLKKLIQGRNGGKK